MIVIERRRRKRHRRKNRVWLVVGLGLAAAVLCVLISPAIVKGWRVAEDLKERAEIERILSANPHDPHTLHAVGLKLAALGDDTSAIIYLEKALEAKGASSNLVFANDYRLHYVRLKEYERATKFLTKLAHEHFPNRLEPHLFLALAYMDRATADSRASAETKERWRNQFVQELTEVIQKDIAETDPERRKRHADAAWVAMYLRGLYYLHSPQGLSFTPRAIDDLQRCLNKQGKTSDKPLPYFALSYIALGDAYVKRNDLPNALRVWKEGRKQFPQNKSLRQRINTNNRDLLSFVEAMRNPDKAIDTDISVLWKKAES